MKRICSYKSLLVFAFLCSFIFGLSVNADAQRRTRTKRSRTVAKTNTVTSAGMKKGAEDVAIQIKNVTKFVFYLGSIANGIQELDKAVREGKATREVADKNAQFKADTVASIRALRAGLVKLEADFRTDPALKPYLLKIQGLTQQSNRVEDLAMAGQFMGAGQELLLVVETLTDTLAAMP